MQLLKVEKFTGWHMTLVMVLFFGTIISVNMTLAYFANASWSGLVVKNSYIASQSFDADTARRKAQNALGWKTEFNYLDSQISLKLKGPDALEIPVDQITAKIGRVTSEIDDRIVILVKNRMGIFNGTSELDPGLWQVDLSAGTASDPIWSKSIRFEVDS